jgi:hypothetical protein
MKLCEAKRFQPQFYLAQFGQLCENQLRQQRAAEVLFGHTWSVRLINDSLLDFSSIMVRALMRWAIKARTSALPYTERPVGVNWHCTLVLVNLKMHIGAVPYIWGTCRQTLVLYLSLVDLYAHTDTVP